LIQVIIQQALLVCVCGHD